MNILYNIEYLLVDKASWDTQKKILKRSAKHLWKKEYLPL